MSVLCQVAGALAVGEDVSRSETAGDVVWGILCLCRHWSWQEHRDLHMSNVMVRETSEEASLFRTRDRDFSVASRGVKATIVDYTLSRMKRSIYSWYGVYKYCVSSFPDDCVSYNDLERLPWLFQGEGDTQFDVYRDMKKATGCVFN